MQKHELKHCVGRSTERCQSTALRWGACPWLLAGGGEVLSQTEYKGYTSTNV